VNVPLIIDEEYGLVEHCQAAVNDLEGRCVKYCYPRRLTKVVRYAAANGFDTFTTTLLYSPYQKHEEIIRICKDLSALSDVEFLYRDFRVGYREGQEKARAAGLYMQKYCGCIFSEADRYAKQIARDSTNHPEPYYT
jgi:predicted adenine nucleotide alpha hydrolase (AANH) superfamily ATPase